MGVVGRSLPVAGLVSLLLIAPDAGGAVVIPLTYACLILFSVANEWARHYEPSDSMGVVNLAASGTRIRIESRSVVQAAA